MAALLQAIRDAWDTGKTAQIQRLLEQDRSLASAKGPRGVTPLLEAARWGYQEMLTLLIAHGAEVNESDDDGRTPLYVAASVGHEGAVEALLAADAFIDSFTAATRWTALHAAAYQGHAGAVGVLLNAGASINVLSATGQSPRDLAREKRHRSTVLVFDTVANQVLLLVSAQQRLAWALGLSTGTQDSKPQGTWAVAPDLVWSVGAMLASASSWMPRWSQTLAHVGMKATEECSHTGRRDLGCGLFMSQRTIAILAAEVARIKRAVRIGSLHRRDHQPICSKGSE